MRSVLRSTLLTALLAGGLAVSLMTGTPASAATTLERAVVTKINASRAAHGLRALPIRVQPDLPGPPALGGDGQPAPALPLRPEPDLLLPAVGENVGYATTVYSVHKALMASPAHRANILDRRWRGVGVGVVQVRRLALGHRDLPPAQLTRACGSGAWAPCQDRMGLS